MRSAPSWCSGDPVQVYAERLRNVTDLLEISSARDDQVLLVHGDRRVSFGEFVPATLTGAERLIRLGVRPGERVLIFSYNCAEFLLAMWAAWRAGAVPVLGNRWWSQRELDAALASVRPALVITDTAGLSFGPAPVLQMDELATWWRQRAGEVALPGGPEEDAVALIVYTAGLDRCPQRRAALAPQPDRHPADPARDDGRPAAGRGQRPGRPLSRRSR